MSDPTYTDRTVELHEITVNPDEKTITYNGWTFGGVPAEHWDEMRSGILMYVETQRLTTVTGMARVGEHGRPEWLWHKSDRDLADEHRALAQRINDEHQRVLDEHRDDWTRREAALPEPLRARLARFRANGGDMFDRDGWGYELVVSELAVLYKASGGTDDDAVEKYARAEGTSGHQHGFARALARGLDEAPNEISGAVAALSPITGDADYSKAGR